MARGRVGFVKASRRPWAHPAGIPISPDWQDLRLAADRPTILQIVPTLDTGGAELSTIEVAEAIVRGGGRALVASEGGRLAPRLRAVGGELIAFPAATKNPLAILWNGHRLARIIRDEGVDLVHARSRAPAWSAIRAARRTARPFVTTYHGAYGEKSSLKRAYNSVMAQGDTVIANSRFTAALIKSRYGTPDERIRVIYRGVPAFAFDPSRIAPERVAALKRGWGVAPGVSIVLHPARVTYLKGHPDVIAAAARLRNHPAELVFILAGDAQGRDGYVAQLEQRIAAEGLGRHVKLAGHCDDMPAAYAAASVALVASTEPESFGRTAIEAQAMGCPVIATDIGALPETVLAEPHVPPEQATGWLVPPGDPDALVGALEAALALTSAERAVLASRARTRVLQSFSVEAMQRATLAVYDGLLGSDLAGRYDRSEVSPPDS